jgi:glycopeptide antibiotics resistance protein
MQNRTRAVVAAVIATAIIAIPVEYAQGWFVGRYPDVTDVAISLGGVALGLLAGDYGEKLFKRWISASAARPASTHQR